VAAAAFSPDGALLATGADDAKVKVWTPASGFCFVTFADHTAPVTAVQFLGRWVGAAPGTAARGQHSGRSRIVCPPLMCRTWCAPAAPLRVWLLPAAATRC
jgi:WD40 repeat protein